MASQNKSYYIIKSDMWRMIRADWEPLNTCTFFELYAAVYQRPSLDKHGILPISFKELDESELSKRQKWAVNVKDTETLDALRRHYQKHYKHLVRHEEDRNNYLGMQRSKMKERNGEQLALF